MPKFRNRLIIGVAGAALVVSGLTPALAAPVPAAASSRAVEAGSDQSGVIDVRRGRNRRAAIVGGAALGLGLITGAAIANSQPAYGYGYPVYGEPAYGYGGYYGDPYYEPYYAQPHYYPAPRPPVVYRAPPRRVIYEERYYGGPAYQASPYDEDAWFKSASGK